MILINKTSIAGLFKTGYQSYTDSRGLFEKIYKSDDFKDINLNFKECYVTTSKKNVIRGMHLQVGNGSHEKLVKCLVGSVIDVVIDLRKESPTYLNVESFYLNDKKNEAIYIPRGCAHGFLSNFDGTKLLYLTTTVHDPVNDTGIHYDSFGFDWAVKNPIVSERDRGLSRLRDFIT